MAEDRYVAPFVLEYSYKRSLGPVLSRFMTGLVACRIEGSRTQDGRVLVPPSEYDPETGEDTVDMVPVGPSGTVQAWTWVAQPRPDHPLDHPFAFALILLDGADTALTHAVDTAESDMVTGMRVQPRWREERVGHIRDIEAFEPVQ
jgi:uncharacterized OB-fold protein